MEKEVTAQQRGKSRHSAAALKNIVDQQHGKGSHSAAVWEKLS